MSYTETPALPAGFPSLLTVELRGTVVHSGIKTCSASFRFGESRFELVVSCCRSWTPKLGETWALRPISSLDGRTVLCEGMYKMGGWISLPA